MIRILGAITASRRAELIQDLDQAAAVGRDYILLVVLSCVIATFGLVLNSGAVIIGAMLIAPLMSSILAFALALVMGDLGRAGRALATLLVGVVLAVALSAALGRLVSAGEFNFLEQLPSEILGRTRPTLFDLAVALAGGAAAAYALSQPQLSATLPGVAIATALMPPLCVVGIGVSQERGDVAGGALLLFLANFVAIVFASSVVFSSVGFRPLGMSNHRNGLPKGLLISTGLLLLVIVPLALFMVRIARDAQENEIVRSTLVEQLSMVGDSSLASFESRQGQDGHLDIVATVRAPRSLTYAEANQIQRVLATRLQLPVAMKFLIVPVTKLDLLVPPTFTPTPLPDATPTPTSTPVPTATPLPTSSPSSTVLPSVTPTALASPTPSPTPRPTATPIVYATVGGTDQEGANLRRVPGLTAVVAGVPDGVLVQLTGRRAEADGLAWVEIVLPDGRTGWIAADYLVPYHAFRPLEGG